MFCTRSPIARLSFCRRGILVSDANSSVMVPDIDLSWDSRELLWWAIMKTPMMEVTRNRSVESMIANFILMPI
jgi:hypothetical protein